MDADYPDSSDWLEFHDPVPSHADPAKELYWNDQWSTIWRVLLAYFMHLFPIFFTICLLYYWIVHTHTEGDVTFEVWVEQQREVRRQKSLRARAEREHQAIVHPHQTTDDLIHQEEGEHQGIVGEPKPTFSIAGLEQREHEAFVRQRQTAFGRTYAHPWEGESTDEEGEYTDEEDR